MNSAVAKVKETDLFEAFEFHNFGGSGELETYICLDTGKVRMKSDDFDEDLDDEGQLSENDLESGRFLPLPHKNELDLGRDLALSFIEEVAPGDYDQVAAYFSRKGAYARFKDLLEIRGLLETWYKFEEQATQRALRQWCDENGIELLKDSP